MQINSAQATPDIHDWVFMRANNLRVLLPQSELININNLDEALYFDKTTGFFYKNEASDEVVLVPSESLQPLLERPKDRYLVTVLASNDPIPFSWCWSEVVLYNDRTFDFQQLPPAFQTENAVFEYYTIINGAVVFLADSLKLHDYVLVQSAFAAESTLSEEPAVLEEQGTT